MPVPTLSKPAYFPKPLHKSKHQPANSATIYGKNIAVGDEVNVNGTRGQKPTNWSGTIAKDNHDGSYDVTDLVVDNEEVSKPPKRVGGGTEDVAVTVTNDPNGTSDPVITPAAKTVVP